MPAPRLIGYTRVSTDGQAAEGVSLEAQRTKLQSYCELYGHKLVAVEEDAGASAKTLDRPALNRALERLEAGEADGLLVAKLDRLTRRVADLCATVETFTDRRWSLLSVAEQIDTSTAGGRMVVNLLSVVAQWEREAIGERTREALAHLRASGVRLGRPRIGTRGGDQETVTRVLELRARGMTYRQIVDELDRLGARTANGGKWHETTVRRVVAAATKEA